MKTNTILIGAGVGLAAYYLWQKSHVSLAANVSPPAQQAKPPAKPALPAAILPRRSTVTTAPVNVSKPLAVKGPSTAQRVLSAGANVAASYGCSPLEGYQRDLCLQGANVGAGLLSSTFKF